MKQQEIDEELLSLHFQTELTAHKCENAAHGPQKALDAGDESAFEISLAVLLAELKEIKGVLISDRQLGLGAKLGSQHTIEIGLAQEGLLVALVLDLVNQHTLGPSEFLRRADVELPLQRVGTLAEDDQVLGPTDFSNQWLEFFVVPIGAV